MGEWQPIETMPSDNGAYLLWGKTDDTWDGPDYKNPNGWEDERYYLLYYEYEHPEAPNGRAFVTTESDDIGESYLHCWATHWMPLPAPPAEGGGDG